MAAARTEANDNVKFLSPLAKYFDKLNMADDFQMLVELFKPIMHTLMLVWKHSKYYNTAARLVVLMREICNDIIMQACKFVEGGTIFEGLPQEAVDKLRTTIRVCGSFKSYYFEYKKQTEEECPENPWRFQNSALFARLDAFLERCHDIQDLSQTMLQFGKLEKVEIGGTKGRALTASVRQIFSDFQAPPPPAAASPLLPASPRCRLSPAACPPPLPPPGCLARALSPAPRRLLHSHRSWACAPAQPAKRLSLHRHCLD